jgi:hypothetical protein
MLEPAGSSRRSSPREGSRSPGEGIDLGESLIMGSDSKTALEGFIARCNESLQRAKDRGWASLTAYRDAGRALLELKEIVPRGQFGLVATERSAAEVSAARSRLKDDKR